MAVQSDLRFTFLAGSDDFDVVEFRLVEGLSETFKLDVDLTCANPAVDFAQAVLKKHSIILDYEQKATKTPIRDGDVAACGARLIASRHGVSWEG